MHLIPLLTTAGTQTNLQSTSKSRDGLHATKLATTIYSRSSFGSPASGQETITSFVNSPLFTSKQSTRSRNSTSASISLPLYTPGDTATGRHPISKSTNQLQQTTNNKVTNGQTTSKSTNQPKQKTSSDTSYKSKKHS